MPQTEGLLDRLSKDAKPGEPWPVLVLAALEGASPLESVLLPRHPEAPRSLAIGAEGSAIPRPRPSPAYLKSITVEGFRGIGKKTALDLHPGPGLTLVVGRNGSGKSSFAEALELLLTGNTYRFKQRSKVWEKGWRSLHHKPASIEAELHIEGEKAPGLAARTWPDDADLAGGVTTFQVKGKPRTDLASLGWERPLDTYRPFLSYNELGSMLDEGPSKLYDALSSILGLDELTAAQTVLADARKTREKAYKEVGERRTEMLAILEQMEDARARTLAEALKQKDWGLDEAEAILAKTAAGTSPDSDLTFLQQLANLQPPAKETVTAVVKDLREAHQRQQAAAGTLAARSKQLSEILDLALKFHTQHGDGDCPVCGKPKALDNPWHKHKQTEMESLRSAAAEVTAAAQAVESAHKKAMLLAVRHPEDAKRPKDLLFPVGPLFESLSLWNVGLATSPSLESLAAHLESNLSQVVSVVVEARSLALAELTHREDRWRPVAPVLATWLTESKAARQAYDSVKPLKTAESWLKQTASDLRTERFEPVKEKAQAIWNQLRLQSNVALDDIRLSGSATKRQVELDVTVDGVEGTALGVMSQGELHALALSLFIPRATLPESPFRFVVIDDPVQSMDPARVDGLACVLDGAAKDRQVVVFTHDDRLPEAVRRLGIEANVIEVTRRENSHVQLRISKDPVARYIEDAMALAHTHDLPAPAARRVIPGLCRHALEAACMESVRRRRLARGERHTDVEQLLEASGKLATKVALALFDDADRTKDVLPRLNKEARDSADTFRWCNEGTHEDQPGPTIDRIRSTEKLAHWLRVQA